MKKFLRWLLFISLFSIGLIIAALVVAYSNRDALLTKITTELNKNINGTLTIRKIDFTFLHNFPSFSVTLQDVALRSHAHKKYPVDVVHAEKVFADLDLIPLVQNEIVINGLSIKNASVFIFKALNGDTNTDLIRRRKNSNVSTAPKINLNHINFDNVLIRYADSTKSKFLQFRFEKTTQLIDLIDSGIGINIKGTMHFDSLHFNTRGGSFLKDKKLVVNLNMQADTIRNEINVLSSSVKYDKYTVEVSGKFNVQPEGRYTLAFGGKDLNAEKVSSLLNAKLGNTLSKFRIKGAVDVTANLEGRSLPGFIPSADVTFATKKADIRYGSLAFRAVALTGNFSNNVDSTKAKDNANSIVRITAFKGKMENIPVEGNVTFSMLSNPLMDLTFTSKPSFRQLNDQLDNERFVFDKGNFETTVSYRGRVSEYLDPTKTRYAGKLSGTVAANNVSFQYRPKKIQFKDLRLNASFDEKNFTIQQLDANLNGSAISIHGMMRDFIPFFITPKHRGYVNLKVSSPEFDLTSFAEKRTPTQKSSASAKQQRKKLSDLLDRIYDRLHFEVDVKADKIKFRKFTSTAFQGRLILDQQQLRANPVSMKIADGRMNLDFSLSEIFQPTSTMNISAKLDKANIKKVFENFNNFNQSTIEAENLEGKITADVAFRAQLDEGFTVLPASMQGRLTCLIVDGALKNFEPMENMSNFLFKKRDFSDVQFAALNSRFSIAGTNMDIERMEIQSSVFSLFLGGRYSFTDSTSLSVQLPLSNLKRRHKDFKPKNVGVDAKTGPSVFLHVYRNKDINSKIKIDYDPFKKWVMK